MSIQARTERYQADLSAGSLMLPESRRIAELMLRRPDETDWNRAIKVDNILQKSTPSTAVRQARLIRFRLELLGPRAWTLIAQGESEPAVQTLFAGALLHSRLLYDFVRQVLTGHHRRLDLEFHPGEWDPFLAECAARDPSLAAWTASTRAKLLQVVVRILVESKYIESSRTLRLRAPHLHPQVRGLLLGLGQDALIATMELQV